MIRKPLEFSPKDIIDSDFETVNSERRKTVVTATNLQTRPINFNKSTTSYKKIMRVTDWIYTFFRNAKSVPSNDNLENHLSFD